MDEYGPDNPFELTPDLQPGLAELMGLLRQMFVRGGFTPRRLVLSIEVDHPAYNGQPYCTSVAWPMNELAEAADLLRQGRTVVLQAHASRQARGQG